MVEEGILLFDFLDLIPKNNVLGRTFLFSGYRDFFIKDVLPLLV